MLINDINCLARIIIARLDEVSRTKQPEGK